MTDQTGSTPDPDQPQPPAQAPQPPAAPPPPPYGASASPPEPPPYYGAAQPPQQPAQQPPYGQPPGGYPPAPGGYPGYGAMSPSGGPGTPPPPNYLVWSILTTIFCCLPLGIVSIVFAAQVNSKWAMGDVAGAQNSSRKARQFAIWSAVASVVLIALYLVVVVLIAGSNN